MRNTNADWLNGIFTAELRSQNLHEIAYNLDYTLAYNHLKGLGVIATNHVCNTYFQILDGEGSLVTPQVVVDVHAGDRIFVARGTRRQLSGNLTYFLEAEPGIYPQFITYGDQVLPKKERAILRKYERDIRREARLSQIINKYSLLAESIYDFELMSEGMRKTVGL